MTQRFLICSARQVLLVVGRKIWGAERGQCRWGSRRPSLSPRSPQLSSPILCRSLSLLLLLCAQRLRACEDVLSKSAGARFAPWRKRACVRASSMARDWCWLGLDEVCDCCVTEWRRSNQGQGNGVYVFAYLEETSQVKWEGKRINGPFAGQSFTWHASTVVTVQIAHTHELSKGQHPGPASPISSATCHRCGLGFPQ